MTIKTVTTALWLALLVPALVFAQQPATESAPAAATTARQREWLKATISERVRMAEQLGEEGAEALAGKKGYQPLLTKAGKVLSQGFDQVYRAKDGSIVVIEAKGGTSAIGRAYGCQQGTPAWAIEAAKRVVCSSRASVAEKQAARIVLEAARNGKLTVQVVRTRHVLGEPVAAVLESSVKASQAEARAAAQVLGNSSATVQAARSTSEAGKAARSAGAAKAGSSAASTGKALEGAGKVAKVVKAAGVAAVAVDGAIRVGEAAETEKKYAAGEITRSERTQAHVKNAAGMAGGLAGAYAGAKGGAAAGAAVGAVFGGVGAPIGAAVGSAVGAVCGYLGGEAAAEAVVNVIFRFWR